MRNKLTLLLAILLLGGGVILAQAPEAINYQAVARNLSGVPLVNQGISVRYEIRQGSSTGTAVYVEDHSLTTNQFGLFTAEIGNGTPFSGTFSGINWGSGSYYLYVEVDGNPMGATQLLSVPYALYSKESANGPAGAPGKNSLALSTPYSGALCPNGGTQVDVGLDDNDDGTLQALEIDFTYYICNGVDGTNGVNGTNGADGVDGNDGVGIVSTVDNGDGTFTINYSDATSFTTSDLTGPAGTNGTTYYPGNGITFSNDTIINAGDNDNDSSNELISTATLNGMTIEITENGTLHSVDLSSIINNNDTSATNELQTISLNATSDTIFLSNGGGYVALPAASGDTDWTQGVGVIYNNTDNVGIGNTNPQTKLSVVSSDSVISRFIGTNPDLSAITVSGTNPNTITGMAFLTGTDSVMLANDPSQKTFFISNNTPDGHMLFNADSSVVSNGQFIGSIATGAILNEADTIYSIPHTGNNVMNINLGTFVTDSLYVVGNNFLNPNWVLANDGNGQAVWTDPSVLGGSGDNWGSDTVNVSGSNILGNGTPSNPLMVIDNDTSATNELITNFDINGTLDSIVIDEGGNHHAIPKSLFSDGDWTQGTGNDLYNNTDSIGIGTTNPQSPIQIGNYMHFFPMNFVGPVENYAVNSYNAHYDGTTIRNTTGGTSGITILGHDNGNPMFAAQLFPSQPVGGDVMSVSPVLRMNLKDKGLGINTDNPAAGVHIKPVDSAAILIEHPDDGSHATIIYQAGDANLLGLKVPSSLTSGSFELTYPTALPTSNGAPLVSDLNGNLSWGTPGGGSPWTDGGTDIYPTTLADNVSIGVISATNAKFQVDNSTEQYSARINQTTAATGFTQTIHASNNSTGNFDKTAIYGASYGTGTDLVIGVNGSANGGNNNRGIEGLASGNVGQRTAVYGSVTGAGTGPTQGLAIYNSSSNTGSSYAATFSNTNSTSSATYGVRSTISSTHTGINNQYGFYSMNTSASASAFKYGYYAAVGGVGSVNYGIYSEVNGATTNWAAYFADGNVYVADTVIIPTNAAAGAVLTSIDASGTAVWQMPAGATSPWTSSGGDIYQTTLTDFVGVGTNTPTEMLSIGSLGTATGVGTQQGSHKLAFTGSYWNGSAVARDFTIHNEASTVTADEGRLAIGYQPTGTEIMSLTSTGRVGLGITTPVSTFNIIYTGTDSEASLVNYTNNSASGNGTGYFVGVNNTGTGTIVAGAFQVGTSGNSTQTQALEANNIADGATNYGIRSVATGSGTSNYGGNFSASGASSINTGVSSSATAAGSAQATGVYGTVSGSTSGITYGVYGQNSATNTGLAYAGYFQNLNSTASAIHGVRSDVNSSSANNQYGLSTFMSTASTGTKYGVFSQVVGGATNWAAYFAAGNVYVADTLVIPTNAAVGAVLTSIDASGKAVWQMPSSSSVWSQNGSNAYYNTGNVGVGMSSPSYLFHIQDSTASAGTDLLRVENSIGSSIMKIDNDGLVQFNQGQVQIYSNQANSLFATNPTLSGTAAMFTNSFASSAAPAMIVKNANANSAAAVFESGRVGIAMTKPNYLFHIQDSTAGATTVLTQIENELGTPIVTVKNNGFTGFGNGNPLATADIYGSFKYNYSAAIEAGSVLTSTDNQGNAVWKPRNVAFEARGTNIQNVDNVPTLLQFDAVVLDDGSNFDPSAGNYMFVVPVSGVYSIQSSVTFDYSSAGPNDITVVEMLVNGTPVYESNVPIVNGERTTNTISTTTRLSPGDFVQIRIYVVNGGSVITTANTESVWFSGHLVYAY